MAGDSSCGMSGKVCPHFGHAVVSPRLRDGTRNRLCSQFGQMAMKGIGDTGSAERNVIENANED